MTAEGWGFCLHKNSNPSSPLTWSACAICSVYKVFADSISQRTQEPLRFGFVADHPFPTRMPEVRVLTNSPLICA